CASLANGATAADKTKMMEMPHLRANSEIGRHLLSQARRLEDNAQEEENAWDMDVAWFTDQEGDEEGGAANGGVGMQNLVRFRLCPANSCSDTLEVGCKKKFGDYVVGLNTFVNAYYEYQQQLDEYECEQYLATNCACEDDGDQGDDFNEEQCEYDCFLAAGTGLETQCVENNPYEEEGEGEDEDWFEAEQYMEECAELEVNNGGERRRRLEDADGGGSGLFIGAYCSEQGGAIYLGGFSDETCSTFADDSQGRQTFQQLTGEDLPYGTENIIKSDKCMSCQYNADMEEGGDDGNNGQGNDVAEFCGNVYVPAGKCEQKLPSGTADEPNNYACSYIDSVKTAFQDDGVAHAKSSSAGTTFFLAMLIVATLGLGVYVYYLRTRLAIQRESINSALIDKPSPKTEIEVSTPSVTMT
ncbi:MAG: hypothetical protein SGILL_005953, partial [Bacillariaceae sp.]